MKKHTFRIFCICALLPSFLAADDAVGVKIWGKSELPPPFYVPFYIGRIYPTPQKATYHDDFISMKKVSVLAGSDIAADDPRIDVLRTRIKFMGGESMIVKDVKAAAPDSTIIALGDTEFGAGVTPPEREQGYVIMPVEEKGGRRVIVLKGHDRQGLLWAIASLNQLITREKGDAVARRAEVHDYPANKLRGYIGRGWHRHAWHKAQRAVEKPKSTSKPIIVSGAKPAENEEAKIQEEDVGLDSEILVSDLEARAWYILNSKMNYVVIGGFQDANRPERGNWRKPPPAVFANGIKRTGELLSPLGIQWYSGYNPCPRASIGNDKWGAGIDTGVEEDFQIILRDARTVAAAGGGFFLAFDDYRFGLLYEESKRFGTAREADSYFLTRLHKELQSGHPGARILFCPPFYWGPRGAVPASYGEDREMYLKKLGEIPRDIDIFWSGPRVDASPIPKENCDWVKWINDLLQRKPVFWQNAAWDMIPRTPRYYYPLDKGTWWKIAFYDGFYEDVKAYLPNCPMGMPDYAIGAMTLSDYLWNPDAYDAARSTREATMMMLGPDAFQQVTALHNALNFFDQYNVGGYELDAAALDRAAANIAEIRRVVKQVELRWKAALKAAPEIERWTAMQNFAGRPQGIVDKLEHKARYDTVSDIANIIREVDKSLAIAVKETGMNPTADILLPACAFSGGVSDRTIPKMPDALGLKSSEEDALSILEERRPAVWIDEKQKDGKGLSARFAILDIPAESDYTLVLSGRERDAGQPSTIRVSVNDKPVFEGPGGFSNQDWSMFRVNVAGNILQKNNTLKMECVNATGSRGFMLNYAVIKAAKEELQKK